MLIVGKSVGRVTREDLLEARGRASETALAQALEAARRGDRTAEARWYAQLVTLCLLAEDASDLAVPS